MECGRNICVALFWKLVIQQQKEDFLFTQGFHPGEEGRQKHKQANHAWGRDKHCEEDLQVKVQSDKGQVALLDSGQERAL